MLNIYSDPVKLSHKSLTDSPQMVFGIELECCHREEALFPTRLFQRKTEILGIF